MAEKDKSALPEGLAAILAASQRANPIFTSESSGPASSVLADWLTNLSAVRTPPVIADRWFKDQTIHIDGYVFERCRFDRCSLVTELATFSFRGCYISPECGLFFKGPSLKIAALLMHGLRLKGRVQDIAGEITIGVRINTDGTFTLE